MSHRLVVHWKRAPYDVYVARPSIWGNPFSHKPGTLAQYRVATRQEAIERHRAWFLGQPEMVALAKRELRGKILACWCAPKTCHADILAEIANDDYVEQPSLFEDGAE